jgi:broad specificity phosphatase PhoE
LVGIGNAELLDRPLTAFFASRTCPGVAIRAAIDWAVVEARAGRTIISGFHSPLERSVLEVILAAHGCAVVALARDATRARVPAPWREAAGQGEIAIVSVAPNMPHLTEDLASTRNDWVTNLASLIVIAHVESGGTLERNVTRWQSRGRQVQVLT